MVGARVCVVCGDATKHAHLGTSACRACAAFFRRTLLAGRKFICRRGDGECVIQKHVPAGICRRCRFEKCLKVGMKLLGTDQAIMDERFPQSSSRSIQVLPYSSYRYQEMQEIADAYQQFFDDRIEAELKLKDSPRFTHHNLPHPFEKFTSSCEKFANECWKLMEGALKEFVARCFPEIVSMPECKEVCNSFMFLLKMYEHNLHGRELLAENTRFIPISMTSCVDLDDPESFFATGLGTSAEQKIESVKHMRHYFEKYIAISRILQDVQLEKLEEAALIALFMYSPGQSCGDGVFDYAEKKRSSLFSQLHAYYRLRMGLDQYSERLGHLCSVAASTKESCALLREEMQIYSILDVFEEDHFDKYRGILLH